MEIILNEEGGTKDQIYENLLKQQVEIVLTAHPTEGTRAQRFRHNKRMSEISPQVAFL